MISKSIFKTNQPIELSENGMVLHLKELLSSSANNQNTAQLLSSRHAFIELSRDHAVREHLQTHGRASLRELIAQAQSSLNSSASQSAGS